MDGAIRPVLSGGGRRRSGVGHGTIDVVGVNILFIDPSRRDHLRRWLSRYEYPILSGGGRRRSVVGAYEMPAFPAALAATGRP
jgi:hypothetical protein